MSELLPKESPTAFAIRVLGITPHAAQSRYLESCARVRVAACGRRFGKTTMAAMRRLWFATVHPGTVQLLTAPTADQVSILFDAIVGMAQESVLAELIGRLVESPFPELALAVRDGAGNELRSTIMARSVGHDAKYLRGLGADSVTVDEAAFVPDLVLSQVLPPILATSSFKELDRLSTPFGTSGGFYEAFVRGLEGEPEVEAFHFPSSANPLIEPGYLERQRQEMSDLAFRTEYLAQFCDAAAAVFRHAAIGAAVDPDVAAGPLDGHEYVIGYDPAKYTDRSGVVVLDSTELPYTAVQVLDVGGRDYLLQAGAVRRLAEQYQNAPILMDATSQDALLEQLERDGVQVEGFRFTNLSKQELIENLAVALEQGDVRIPNHEGLLRELTYYRFETTSAGNVKLGAPAGRGHFDDLVTALALAVWQARRGRRDYVPHRPATEQLDEIDPAGAGVRARLRAREERQRRAMDAFAAHAGMGLAALLGPDDPLDALYGPERELDY